MNSRRPAAAILGLLLLSIVFGVLMAYVKGTGAGLRDEIGNTSAPWLILPLLVGRIGGSRLAATVLGGLSALLSVLAFYVTVFLADDLFSWPPPGTTCSSWSPARSAARCSAWPAGWARGSANTC